MHNYEQNAHLSECIALAVRMEYDDAFCICPEVRACEARVEAKHRAIHDATRAAQRFDYEQGRTDALDAARDAVERVGQQHPKWDLMSTHYEDCWRHHSECALTLALAAIDALRGEA